MKQVLHALAGRRFRAGGVCALLAAWALPLVAQQHAALSLSRGSIEFAAQAVNSQSGPQTVTLQNRGTTAIATVAIIALGDYVQENDCGEWLQAQSACTVSVYFRPLLPGTRYGAVLIPGTPMQYVALSGLGEGGQAAVTPSSLIFPDMALKDSSAQPLNIQLVSMGTQPLKLYNIGKQGHFQIVSSNCPAVVPIGSNCTLQVAFAPDAPGESNGALLIADNGPSGHELIPLHGRAMAPRLAFQPQALNFPATVVAQGSPAQSLTITNNGNAPWEFTDIGTAGDFQQVNDCISPTPPGASCTVQLTFRPGQAGPRTGVLSIQGNQFGGDRVPLSGVGSSFSMTLSSDTLTSKKDDSPSFPITLTGNYGFNSTVLLTCQNLPENVQCNFDQSSPAISGGDAVTVNVTLVPPDHNRDKIKGDHDISVVASGAGMSQSVVLHWTVN